MKTISVMLVISTVGLLSACTTMQREVSSTAVAAIEGSLEEIYITRSVREERIQKSSWCTSERAGFEAAAGGFAFEDRFSM